MKIDATEWRELEPLLDHALDLAPAERDTWLGEVEATRPALAPLLRQLLASAASGATPAGVETGAMLGRLVAARQQSPGQRIGPFELQRALGRGGMGEVWFARQVGDGPARDVALKLPLLLGAASLWQERFRRERDILARLQHPNIATLYDAGLATLDGGALQPYLAMEYVDGAGLLDHAQEQSLGTLARIALFRQVLAAVGFAHRQLVVHRDLKPANILVNRAGEVKLLDFGIAKLVDDEGGAPDELTRVAGRMLTPRYAAPEQVEGGAISTATDVYALGVVLHELLTGHSPYRRVREGRHLAPTDLVAEAHAGFGAPSSLSPGLDRDLDAIILKALRHGPADRYGTVEQLDDDLRRHLARRPVLARQGDRRYRLGRFIARNRVPLAAGLVVLAVLVGGLVMVDRARRVAVSERNRAERHFASVRTLANTFIYDIEKQLRGLAGTLPARRQLAETSIKYLDTLAAESQGDPALMAEVGGGYRRLGEVLDGAANGSVGDYDAAVANFTKAARLLDAAGAQGLATVHLLEDRQRVHYELGGLLAEHEDARWQEEYRASIEAAGRLAALPDATSAHRVLAPVLMLELERTRYLHDQSAKPDLARLGEIEARLAALEPVVGADVRARGNLAIGFYTLGSLLHRDDSPPADIERALAAQDRALAMLRGVERDQPDDLIYAAQVDTVATARAMALLALGRAREADEAMTAVLAHSAAIAARDRANMDLQVMDVANQVTGVKVAWRTGDAATTIARAREVWRHWATLPANARQRLPGAQSDLAIVDIYAGVRLLSGSRADQAEGCRHLRAASAYLPTWRKEAPDDAADTARLAQLQAGLRRCAAP